MMNFAMENEDPIFEYTHQSGEGFRFLLPGLGRFMGKNQEQARYSVRNNLPWCESPWCAEERRHSNAFARMIERLVHISPSRENPNQPMAVTASEADAVQHLIARQTSEWNAASSYIVMAAHSAGGLRTLVRNIARDEVKHLAILSCADWYLFGPRPRARLVKLVKLGLENYRQQRKIRSGGNILGGNLALSVEGIFSHSLTALFLTLWLRKMPLRTLTRIFETPSRLPELAASELSLSPERQAEIESTLVRGKAKRASLERWLPAHREAAQEWRRFDLAGAAKIQEMIASRLERFRGAEMPGTIGEREVLRLIAGVRNRKMRRSLLECLRDYQVHHNRHVLERGPHPARALRGERVAGEIRPVAPAPSQG